MIVRDDESIAACDEYGIAMVFTGKRHFGTNLLIRDLACFKKLGVTHLWDQEEEAAQKPAG